MSANPATIPTESDIAAVEERLGALWSDLNPAQQALLDTIITAGITALTADDTAGFVLPTHHDLLATMQSRTAELQSDWQRVNAEGGHPRPARRWNLRAVLNFFREAPAVTQTPASAER